jgi:hypothetical protein
MKPSFSVPPANGQGPRKKAIPGQFIARATTSYPRNCRAEDAAQWLRGKAEVVPTLKLAAATFHVQPAEVMAARKRLEQRERANAAFRVGLSDDAVERIVVEIGPERVLKVVDKLTEPPLPVVLAAE